MRESVERTVDVVGTCRVASAGEASDSLVSRFSLSSIVSMERSGACSSSAGSSTRRLCESSRCRSAERRLIPSGSAANWLCDRSSNARRSRSTMLPGSWRSWFAESTCTNGKGAGAAGVGKGGNGVAATHQPSQWRLIARPETVRHHCQLVVRRDE